MNTIVTRCLPETLDAWEDVARRHPLAALRWVLVHLHGVSPGELSRIRRLGVGATTNPISYLWRSGAAEAERLGGAERMIPHRSLVRARIPVGIATDNKPPDPWLAFRAAVDRRDMTSGQVLGPGERLSRLQTLRALTAGWRLARVRRAPARHARRGAARGSRRAGPRPAHRAPRRARRDALPLHRRRRPHRSRGGIGPRGRGGRRRSESAGGQRRDVLVHPEEVLRIVLSLMKPYRGSPGHEGCQRRPRSVRAGRTGRGSVGTRGRPWRPSSRCAPSWPRCSDAEAFGTSAVHPRHVGNVPSCPRMLNSSATAQSSTIRP